MSPLSLTTSLLLLKVSVCSQLVELLQFPISDAQCVARCAALPSRPSQEQCYQVCKFRQKHPDTELCRLPHLCVDLGCQVACNDDHQASEALIDSFSRAGCQLSWSVSAPDVSPLSSVVFVLAGRDHAGDMWSLIKGNLTEPTFLMTEQFGSKYHTLAIVAVSSQSVRDVVKVKVPRHLHCSLQTVLADIKEWDLVAVVSLSLLVMGLLLTLVALLCCRGRHTEQSSRPDWEHQTRDLSRTEEDGEKKCSVEKKGSEERERATENVYTAAPSSDLSLQIEEEYSYISYDFEV